jgi:type II secretory pathway pseudopilin PulG
MEANRHKPAPAFTLMETVIAIGVLAVLVTAFLAVFGPATAGIRRSINLQEADRLVATLEKELAIQRDPTGGGKTAFDKAFDWIRDSGGDKADNKLIMLYQYRGDPDDLRTDGTMAPYKRNDGVAGKDYIIQSMARLRNDPLFIEDIKALAGRVFAVKTRQLVYKNNALAPIDQPGQIQGMNDGGKVASANDYPDAVIAFTAEFYDMPSNSEPFLRPGGALKAQNLKKPIFTRNLGVRR